MEYTSDQDGMSCVIRFSGKFSFSDNDAVKNLINETKVGDYKQCTVDLSGLESIDSAGLGMLLLLNDSVQGFGKTLEFTGATGQVEKMLEISNFSEVLNIRN